MSVVSHDGWPRCGKLTFGEVELVVTMDIGPRVIHCGLAGEPNVFHVDPQLKGRTGDSAYHGYGGHRFWLSPEVDGCTNYPDNGAVDVRQQGDATFFVPAADPWHLRRELGFRGLPNGGVEVIHIARNEGAFPVTVAPWGISQMKAGGVLVLAQPPFVPWDDRLLPYRPIVWWGYAKMNDPRFSFGEHTMRVSQSAEGGATKIGLLDRHGAAVYYVEGQAFVMRFAGPVRDFPDMEPYPDFGCNFECYTRHDLLEVESLGPFVTIEPGKSVTHREHWYLRRTDAPPAEDRSCRSWFDSIVNQCPPLT